jgi:hypothetical protein
VAEYQVTEVTGVREWRGKYGNMCDYKLVVRGSDNVEHRVEWSRKSDSAEPHPGDKYEATIDVQERQKKDGTPFTVKKFKPDFGGSSSSPKRFETPNGIGPTPSLDSGRDATGRSIERQVALKAAVEYVVSRSEEDEEHTPSRVVDIAAAFDAFLKNEGDFPGDDGSLPELPDTDTASPPEGSGAAQDSLPAPVPPPPDIELPPERVDELVALTRKVGVKKADVRLKLVALGVQNPEPSKVGLKQLTPGKDGTAAAYLTWLHDLAKVPVEPS